VVGTGVACIGSVDLFLGRLAVAMERLDRAVEHLEVAVEVNQRFDAVPWVARSRFHLADALTRNGRGGTALVGELLSDCATSARRLGMASLTASVDRARGSLVGGGRGF
jgi:hypothetical protein